ncbi:glycosyltransferase [Candidatus Saganbacteria bacterium]|nr:glycosyltransferase [Candidatus Saganbacteria bacterium]
MKVSVIIASYNYGNYLKGALDSALMQNYPNFEVVVVYRPSGDGTEQVLAGYQGRIKVIKQAGQGLANASNLGIKNSDGDYVIRLDADDSFYPDILAEEARVLAEEPAVDFVYPDYVYNIERTGERVRKTLPAFDREELHGRGDFLSGGTMFRRSLFDKVGLYDEKLPTLESYEFILRLMKQGILGRHLSAPLFEYRIHEKSMSDNKELVAATGRQIAAKYGLEYIIGANHPRVIK